MSATTDDGPAPAPDGGPDDPSRARGVRVGERAPAFDLPGIDGSTGEERRFTLADFAGAPLIVAFYPADNTPVCTAQLRSYTSDLGLLDESGAQVIAISPQDTVSHREFAASQGGFGFPLLSDVDKSVGAAYGILGLLDLYRRSTFVLDGDGIVVHAHRAIGLGQGYEAIGDLVKALP